MCVLKPTWDGACGALVAGGVFDANATCAAGALPLDQGPKRGDHVGIASRAQRILDACTARLYAYLFASR